MAFQGAADLQHLGPGRRSQADRARSRCRSVCSLTGRYSGAAICCAILKLTAESRYKSVHAAPDHSQKLREESFRERIVDPYAKYFLAGVQIFGV